MRRRTTVSDASCRNIDTTKADELRRHAVASAVRGGGQAARPPARSKKHALHRSGFSGGQRNDLNRLTFEGEGVRADRVRHDHAIGNSSAQGWFAHFQRDRSAGADVLCDRCGGEGELGVDENWLTGDVTLLRAESSCMHQVTRENV